MPDSSTTATPAKPCWCPGFEPHWLLRFVCRNCRHGAGEHPGGGRCVSTRPAKPQRSEDAHRARVVDELLATERTYIAGLRALEALGTRAALAPAERAALCPGTASVLALQCQLLEALEAARAACRNPADCAVDAPFVRLAPAMRALYKEPTARYTDALALLHRLCRRPAFLQCAGDVIASLPSFSPCPGSTADVRPATAATATAATIQDPEASNASSAEATVKAMTATGTKGTPTAGAVELAVGGWLISVMQRLPRYVLLLGDLRRHCTRRADAARVDAAVAAVEEAAADVNRHLRAEEGAGRMAELQRTLVGRVPPQLVEAHRTFCAEHDVAKITTRGVVHCRLFVFSDLVVYAHTRLGPYWGCKGWFELAAAWVRTLPNSPPEYPNMFQIVAKDKTWTFYADDAKAAAACVASLTAAIAALEKNNPGLARARSAVAKAVAADLTYDPNSTPNPAVPAAAAAPAKDQKGEVKKDAKAAAAAAAATPAQKDKDKDKEKEKELKEKERLQKEKEKEKELKEKEKEKARQQKEKEKEKELKEKEKEKARKEKEKEKAKKEKEKEKAKKEKEKAKEKEKKQKEKEKAKKKQGGSGFSLW